MNNIDEHAQKSNTKSQEVGLLFKSYSEANAKGFFSVKQLARVGVILSDQQRSQCRGEVYTELFGKLPVYELPKTSDPIQSNDPIDQTSPPSPIPVTIAKQATIGILKDLRRKKVVKKPCVIITKKVFVSQKLLDSLPPELACYRDEIARFLDTLHREGFTQQRKQHEFKHLKFIYLANKFSKIREWLPRALALGLLERDHRYQIGFYSMGYRIAEPYRSKHQLIEVPVTAKQSRHKHRYHSQETRYIDMSNDEFTLDGMPEAEEQDLERRDYELHLLREHVVFDECDDFGHRYHNALTVVGRKWRACLRVRGQQPQMADIVNSQPLVLATILRDKGIADCDEFVRLCESGELYDTISLQLGVERSQAKKGLISSVFFGKNNYTGIYHTWMADKFPSVWNYIKKVKKTDYKRLARILQRQESKIVIYTIVTELMRTQTWCATIHDALLFLPQDADIVLSAIKDAFAKHGVRVTIKHTRTL